MRPSPSRRGIALSTTAFALFALSAFAGIFVILPQAPTVQAATPSVPQVLQTQDFNFRITPHLVQNSSGCVGNLGCYTYVTPSGNHSFSKALPWLEKDTSLWKNATTTFHAYGIIETLILVPSAPAVSAGATLYSVNTTQKTLIGGITHGYLFVSYDFSKTPPKESAKYREATGVTAPFNILGGVASSAFPYLSTDGTTYLATSGGLLNAKSGSYSRAFLSSTSTGAGRFSVSLDWSDYGSASILYGQFVFNGVTYQGVLVRFPLNVASVDPTVVQTTACGPAAGSSGTCAYASNVTSGNLLVVAVQATKSVSSVSDTVGSVWASGGTYTSCPNTNGWCLTVYYSASAASSAADTVTVTLSASGSWDSANGIRVFEVSGSGTSPTSGTGTCSSSCGTAIALDSSLSYAGNSFLVSIGTTNLGTGTVTAGSGFTAFGTEPNFGEYSTSASVTSPSTFPITGSGTISNFQYLAVAFQTTITQPITCTTDNSGTQLTLALSGASIIPTTKLCNGASTNFNCVSGATITATEPADGANTRGRFSGGGTTTTVSCSITAWTFTNYNELQNTYQASPKAQTTWDSGLTAPNVVGTVAGTASTTICSITLTGGGGAAPCSGWGDYNRAVVIGGSTIAGAPANSQWLRNGACSSSSTTGGNTNNCDFYKQWTNTYQLTANGATTFDSGLSSVVVTGNSLGASATVCTITVTGGVATATCSGYIDNAATPTVPTTIGTPPTNSRWTNNCALGSVTTGGGTINCNEWKQWTNQFAYSVSGGGAPTAPTFTANSLGVSTPTTLNTTLAAIWVDNAATCTVTNPTTGSTSTERWDTQTACPTASAGGGSTTFAFYHQLLITDSALSYTYTQFGSAQSATTVNQFVDSGTSVSVTADGYIQAWTISAASWVYEMSTQGFVGIQLLGDQAISAITGVISNPSTPYLTFTTASSSHVKGFIPSPLKYSVTYVKNNGVNNAAFTFVSNILDETGLSPHEWDFSTGQTPGGGSVTPPSTTGGGGGGGGAVFIPPPPIPTVTPPAATVPVPDNTVGVGILGLLALIGGAVVIQQYRQTRRTWRLPKVGASDWSLLRTSSSSWQRPVRSAERFWDRVWVRPR